MVSAINTTIDIEMTDININVALSSGKIMSVLSILFNITKNNIHNLCSDITITLIERK